jgi:hypothetical protein
MQGDPTTPDPKGSISIEQYPEIRDWCTRLGCTEIELAEAIALVGYSPDVVRVFLAKAALKPSTG